MCAKLEQNSTFVYGIVVQFGFSIFAVSGDAGVRLVREFPLIVSVLMSEATCAAERTDQMSLRLCGRCYAALFTSGVENVCLGRSIATLWLYTRTPSAFTRAADGGRSR